MGLLTVQNKASVNDSRPGADEKALLRLLMKIRNSLLYSQCQGLTEC